MSNRWKMPIFLAGGSLMFVAAGLSAYRLTTATIPLDKTRAANLISIEKSLVTIRELVGGDQSSDETSPEVVGRLLEIGVSLPSARPDRPKAEEKLLEAMRARSEGLASLRDFTAQLTRDDGPAPGSEVAFASRPALLAILKERSEVVEKERQLQRLLLTVEASGEGTQELSGLLVGYRESRVADQSLIKKADAATKAPFPPANVEEGSTLLIVLPASGLEVPGLAAALGRLIESHRAQLIGGAAWSLEARGLRRWSATSSRGNASDDQFGDRFNKAVKAIPMLDRVRGQKPFQTLIVWASEYNPDGLDIEVRLDSPPPKVGFEWVKLSDQKSKRLESLFSRDNRWVDLLNQPNSADGDAAYDECLKPIVDYLEHPITGDRP